MAGLDPEQRLRFRDLATDKSDQTNVPTELRVPAESALPGIACLAAAVDGSELLASPWLGPDELGAARSARGTVEVAA